MNLKTILAFSSHWCYALNIMENRKCRSCYKLLNAPAKGICVDCEINVKLDIEDLIKIVMHDIKEKKEVAA